MAKLNCPICKKGGTVASVHPEGKDISVFYCEICGTFEISRTLELTLMHKEANPKLSYALRKRFDKGEENSINTGNVEEIIGSVAYPDTIVKKTTEIINYLYDNQDIATRGLALGDQESYRFGIANNDELSLVIRTSEDKKLLIFDPKFASGGGVCTLAGDGVLLAEKLKSKEGKIIANLEKEESNNFNAVLGFLAGAAGLIGVASVVDNYVDNKTEAEKFQKVKDQYEKRAMLIGNITDSSKLKAIDEDAYNTLVEVIQMFVYGFNRASVVFSGALIDHLLKKKAYTGNFNQNIETAKAQKLISPQEYHKLQIIRLERNDYIHQIDKNISEEDAVFVINLTIKMLEQIL